MQVAIDYTPALNQGAGVGRYTRNLVQALSQQLQPDDHLLLWAAGRHQDNLAPASNTMPGGKVQFRQIPIGERWLTIAWHRLHIPLGIERLIGRVDVVHGPDFVAPPSSAPLVATIHDLSYLVTPEFAHPKLRRYLSQAVPYTLRRAVRVVAVSSATAQDLVDYYQLDPARIAVIHNGVDPTFHPPEPGQVERTLTAIGVHAPYFLIVGTVEPRKNHQTLLRAFEQVHKKHPEISLVIAGRPGWLSEPIVAEIERCARRVPIHFLRYVDETMLPALYAGSIALVYPSWYEGFGLPVIEAMASGTAVITSERSALREIAGDAALTVDPGDPDALAEAMSCLVGKPETRQKLISRGREHAARFTWDRTAELHWQLYREVIDAL